MAHEALILLSTMLAGVAQLPSSAAGSPTAEAAAPAGGPETRYCLRVEAITGTRLETIRCWTREEWAALEVDVDSEWAKEGVRVIG